MQREKEGKNKRLKHDINHTTLKRKAYADRQFASSEMGRQTAIGIQHKKLKQRIN
jgi:hypothetical protein